MSTVDRSPGISGSKPGTVPADGCGPITLALYDRMIAAGVFDPAEDRPMELVEGELHMMSPIGDRHADAVAWLTRWSAQVLDMTRVIPWVQNPLGMPDSQSAPQPDIAWVVFRRYVDRRPRPDEVSLVVEVADTSLEYDTGPKARLYASAGIPEYWVVDLIDRAVIVWRDPRAGRYETRATHRGAAAIHPLALPEAALIPDDLFATG